MRKYLVTAIILLASANTRMIAQNSSASLWSLDDCIEYAIKENIQLKKSQVLKYQSEVNWKSAKADLFPSLSFSIGQNMTNTPWKEDGEGNFIQGAEGTIYNSDSNSKTSYNGNYALSAQWVLFNGGQRLKSLKQEKMNTRVAELNVEQQENSIKEEITQLYVQILYAAESVKTNENTVELSAEQMRRGKELLTAGSIAEADYAQLESQYASDKYRLVDAKSTLRNYKLQLKQLLEIDGSIDFEIDIPEVGDEKVITIIPSIAEVYSIALTFRPEIQSSKIEVEASGLGIGVAQAGYMPTISMNAGVSTSHSNGIDNSLSYKLKNGWRNTVGLSLSLPIFNNRQTKSAVEKARLQNYDSQLNYQNTLKELYKTIETLWMNTSVAQEQFKAAGEKLTSAQKSYDLASQQFALGMKNTVDMLTQKNTLLAAQQETLQAKYMALLNIGLLKFYQGENIQL